MSVRVCGSRASAYLRLLELLAYAICVEGQSLTLLLHTRRLTQSLIQLRLQIVVVVGKFLLLQHKASVLGPSLVQLVLQMIDLVLCLVQRVLQLLMLQLRLAQRGLSTLHFLLDLLHLGERLGVGGRLWLPTCGTWLVFVCVLVLVWGVSVGWVEG